MKLTIKHDDIRAELSHGHLQIGKENGYTPLELLIASIAGCSAIVFRTILEKSVLRMMNLRLKLRLEEVKFCQDQ